VNLRRTGVGREDDSGYLQKKRLSISLMLLMRTKAVPMYLRAALGGRAEQSGIRMRVMARELGCSEYCVTLPLKIYSIVVSFL
jgi:hypothetical protein